ncbi:MAG TPA: hypothetical protein HPQ04_15225, partial [Rhodospirillaceae bacterium]|nr:hypothetical protein [Rhodospirillaceae bacterium]
LGRLEDLLSIDDMAAGKLFHEHEGIFCAALGIHADQIARNIENFAFDDALAALKAAR